MDRFSQHPESGISTDDIPARRVGVTDSFALAVAVAERAGVVGPELLPERLARGVAAALRCDGAGVSMAFRSGRRVPLGASDPTAAFAERLQFTVGEGPCIQAQTTRRPVPAGQKRLVSEWPAFYADLVAGTPYRAVLAVPLDGELLGVGAVDLFFSDTRTLATVPFVDVLTVAGLVEAHLMASAGQLSGRADGPAWLDAPAAGRRSQVWQALGVLNVGVRVGSSDAMALLRAHAYATGRVVDDVAADLLDGRLEPRDLAADEQPHD